MTRADPRHRKESPQVSQSPSHSAEPSGYLKPGYEPFADTFRRNFEMHGESGAAFAATRNDELVVDIWGGTADAASLKPWDEHTLSVTLSGTNGVTAICLAIVIDRSLVRLEDPVHKHWSEFAANGKDAISIGISVRSLPFVTC
jgi:CubicO group peptidase (beta-lactamase class C family)